MSKHHEDHNISVTDLGDIVSSGSRQFVAHHRSHESSESSPTGAVNAAGAASSPSLSLDNKGLKSLTAASSASPSMLGHRPLDPSSTFERQKPNTVTGICTDEPDGGERDHLSADLTEIFAYNERWAASMKQQNAMFFKQLAAQQAPKFLWIGCSDSRVPANQLMGLAPGEVFVHRNVANVVNHTDLNCLSVLQYAVEVLKVEHIIVCGHYGCGGVRAATRNEKLGLIDNWIRSIKDVYHANIEELSHFKDADHIVDRVCELNVREQVGNVCQTSIVQDAWDRGQTLAVHGWMYDIRDGLLREQHLCVTGKQQLHRVYRFES